MFKKANSKAVRRKNVRGCSKCFPARPQGAQTAKRTLCPYVEGDARLRTQLEDIFSDRHAEVVEWQTRTFEGRVAQAVRVQVPPSAPIDTP